MHGVAGDPILALDLGGTQIRAAVVDGGGSVRHAFRARTPVEAGSHAIVAGCIDALRSVRAAHEATAGAPALAGVGISAPGPVDPRTGRVLDPPNLGQGFRDVPLAELVAGALDLPAFLDRDTQVAALAERRFGAAAGCDDFLYLTVSTGIGGAIVSGGRLLRGPDGTAGELGHMLVDRDGPLCGCGMPGHLEAIASGSGIARAAREAAARGASEDLAARIAARGAAFGARDVAAAEEAGDPAATAIMADARDAFAVSCVALADIFNPSRIVVGGSLAVGQGERLLAPARAAVAAGAFRRPAARAEFAWAALGDDVGLVGAVVLVEDRMGGAAP